MIAMTQILESPDSTSPKTMMRKKRQHVPNDDLLSATIDWLERNSTDAHPMVTSHISHQPLPSTPASHSKYSAISSFMQHLKQMTSASTVEIVCDNPASFSRVEDGVTVRRHLPPPYPRASSKQQQENGQPHRIVMTPDQKKHVRWETHSSTYKVEAAAAAVAGKDSSNTSHDSNDPSGSMSVLTTGLVPLVAPVRRGSATAPTCPRRRKSKEDCLQLDDDEDSSESSNDNGNNTTLTSVTAATNISLELTKLREQIEREEEHVKQIDQQTSPKQVREQQALVLRDSKYMKQTQTILWGLEKDETRPRGQSASEPKSQRHRSCSEAASSTKFIPAKGYLLDYKMALNAVALRYATGSAGSTPCRSVSTGMLRTVPVSTSTTTTTYVDAPVGIPRRRESNDKAIVAVLDEASALAESPSTQ
jgi:hypothetical protein